MTEKKKEIRALPGEACAKGESVSLLTAVRMESLQCRFLEKNQAMAWLVNPCPCEIHPLNTLANTRTAMTCAKQRCDADNIQNAVR